jgi:hypothetical protein
MEVNCDSETPERSISSELSEIDWGVELVAVIYVSSLPVFSVSDLRNPPNSSHKVVRRIRLALYCALGVRRVDLVESGDLEDQV